MPSLLTLPLETRISIFRYILSPGEVDVCEAHERDVNGLRIPHHDLRWTDSLPLYLVCHQVHDELRTLRPPKASLKFCTSTCAERFIHTRLDDIATFARSIRFSTFLLPTGSVESLHYQDMMAVHWSSVLLGCLGWTELKIEDVAEHEESKLVTLSP